MEEQLISSQRTYGRKVLSEEGFGPGVGIMKSVL